MNELNLSRAKERFEKAAKNAGDLSAVNEIAQGLSLLADSLMELSRDIERIKEVQAPER